MEIEEFVKVSVFRVLRSRDSDIPTDDVFVLFEKCFVVRVIQIKAIDNVKDDWDFGRGENLLDDV